MDVGNSAPRPADPAAAGGCASGSGSAADDPLSQEQAAAVKALATAPVASRLGALHTLSQQLRRKMAELQGVVSTLPPFGVKYWHVGFVY